MKREIHFDTVNFDKDAADWGRNLKRDKWLQNSGNFWRYNRHQSDCPSLIETERTQVQVAIVARAFYVQ